VDTLLTIAADLGFISKSEFDDMTEKMNKISYLLNGLIKKLKTDLKPLNHPVTTSLNNL